MHDKNSYLSFYIGKELMGINVKHVHEVLLNEPLTAIPRTEDFIIGVLNFRGEIVTVIDFAEKLNLSQPLKREKSVVIIVELDSPGNKVKIGLNIDRVRKVFELRGDELKTVPEFGQHLNPEYLIGVAKTTEGLTTLLDVEKILNEKEVNIMSNTKKNIK